MNGIDTTAAIAGALEAPLGSSGGSDAVGFVGPDVPIEVLLASGRPFGHLPWHATDTTPWADRWLESSFPYWARSILEQWHAGVFDKVATDLLDILPAVEAFASRYDAVFNFVGFDDSVLPEGVKSRCRINAIPWSEETEIKEILNFDIGIMPLRSDPWSQGKCGFKLVQYMSCKKPVIASPVGINTSLVEDGVNGYLAETPEEWLKAFEALYRDENLRKKMSDANDAKMLDEYNHAKNCKMYIRLIHESVGK